MIGVAVQRTVSYMRATRPVDLSLEVVLRRCLEFMPNTDDTRLLFRDGHAEVRHRRDRGGRVFLHIASWTDGQEASVVPHVSGSPDAALRTRPPEPGTDYLDGDGMVMAHGNHCLVMPSGMHPKALERYLRDLVEYCGDRDIVPRDAARFELLPIGNPEMVRRVLEQGGAKRIHLNIARYMESALREDDMRPRSIVRRVGRDVWDALLTNDRERAEIEAAENVNVKLIISIDRRRRGLDAEALMEVARRVAESESDDDVMIETVDGERVARGDLVLRKQVKVAHFGKTVGHGGAWDEMSTYYDELRSRGILEAS